MVIMLEFNEILKVLSAFLVRTANPSAGVDAPIDVKVPYVIFRHELGVFRQAGIVITGAVPIK